MPGDDGIELLTSSQAGPLLSAAVAHAGGNLVEWSLDQVDRNPNESTTATYSVYVDWPYGRRHEVLGVSARTRGIAGADAAAEIFADGDRQVAVWLYPKDPDLPGLARAAYAESMAVVCNDHKIFSSAVAPDDLSLTMVVYRPRRRAVLKVTDLVSGETVYVKVLREHLIGQIAERHRMLLEAGVPAAPVLAVTEDHMLFLAELGGTPLAEAIFEPDPPTTAQDLIETLDRLPQAVSSLPRRAAWTQSLPHYSEVVAQSLPQLRPRLEWLRDTIAGHLADIPLGDEPTHGDFHEGQVHVASGRVVGLLDVDTVGPGSRVDDLACLVAHLSTIQRMNATQTDRVHSLIRDWVPVFDTRVDAAELRLRAAAVIISLATGPFRSQEPDWQRETTLMIGSAEALVRQVV
ncbi:MAG: aminoglycoside phosphotransferase family protein [Propionibacteriaceae bacterium]|nr:aminoglycoside phosphotransferase family protein [Propionibacteriaceae bacterium]